jgi:hypothetical protein
LDDHDSRSRLNFEMERKNGKTAFCRARRLNG